ncbi:hypothetical protein Ctob_003761 [Chrysochromulina tobinii]|uniref:Uncharacterized protein n=1 Tax=Chrysochromulina tobinii TaxID=1460289 RepID=A0A0M0JER9_9EUKA|nr:hypothetical protein Ctob_003761 [Chrysochromulina tobinii]|eukprot:KOO24935.1 hypothetical protein Ctob_003761 [Chrysochromulina sp. CCMP291]
MILVPSGENATELM